MAVQESGEQQYEAADLSEFDPLAVPKLPNELSGQQQRNTHGAADDQLVELAVEQLFTGSRTSLSMASARPASAVPAESAAFPLSSDIRRSLTAATHVSLFALSGLIREQMASRRQAAPPMNAAAAAASRWNVLGPLRRHSIATGTVSEDSLYLASGEAPDTLRDDLVQLLRSHTTEYAPTATTDEGTYEEIYARVEELAQDMPPADAELAQSLASLLSCIERLDTSVLPASNAGPSADKRILDAALEVAAAERELLWGRICDLSERIGQLSSARDESDALPAVDFSSFSFGSHAQANSRSPELPSYTFDSTALPPEYEHSVDAAPSDKDHYPDEKQGAAPAAERLGHHQAQPRRRVSSIHNEKLARDLESVSTAIERLYLVSPQLANQRVEPDRIKIREQQLAKLGNAIERLSKGRLNDQRASSPRRSPEVLAERQARRDKLEDAAFEKMIAQIDRAASRTLADQRVVLSGKRKSVLLNPNPSSSLQGQGPAQSLRFDPDEQQRRKFILEHTGRGRLDSQDAVFKAKGATTSATFPEKQADEPLTIAEFFKKEFMLRRSQDRRGSAPDVLLTAGTSSKATEGYGQRVEVSYIAEGSLNLGSTSLTVWPAAVFEGDALIEHVAGQSARIVSKRAKTFATVDLPKGGPFVSAALSRSGSLLEGKLTYELRSPTTTRHDLEVRTPWPTKDLQDARPSKYRCEYCGHTLVNASKVTKYNALPSEYWAELLDAWMCHQDQKLNDDLVAKGKGIRPGPQEALVGSSSIVFDSEHATGVSVSHEGKTEKSEIGETMRPAICSNCHSPVGYHVEALDAGLSTVLRLWKHSSYPDEPLDASAKVKLPRHSIACHVTTELLERSQAHATHRFAVEDAESETLRLLLWFFNPALDISFGPARPDFERSEMKVVKVFYQSVDGDADPAATSFMSTSGANVDRVSYPRKIVDRLRATLEASTSVYPIEKRDWAGTMRVGFLERQ